MIEVENLTRNYGEFVAVDGVSFSIDKGEIVGLLGPNGAGKLPSCSRASIPSVFDADGSLTVLIVDP